MLEENSMTYAELLEFIQSMNDEQLEQTVTIYVSGVEEYYGLVTSLLGDLMVDTAVSVSYNKT